MNITLHIDRLVLEGIDFPPDQQHLLQAHVISELTRLLENGRLVSSLTGDTALARLPVDSIQLAGNDPVKLGQQIAQSVYGGIGRE